MSAMNWMGGLSLLLFWIPVLGPFIAGLVGGRKAGTIRRAVLAVFLPAVLMGALAVAAVAYLTHLLAWGILAGIGTAALLLVQVGPMFGGAVIGGMIGEIAARRRGVP